MATITRSVESARGCGYRKKGGIYLRSDGPGIACCRLPIALTCCAHCGAGIKPHRGWTWIMDTLFADQMPAGGDRCESCPAAAFGKMNIRMGLLWVGEQFYKTPEDFLQEGAKMGISRRLHQLPKDFKLGETWVALAHRRAVHHDDADPTPGVFQIFKPQRVEYVVTGKETEEELDRLEKRGFTLVDVIPDVEQQKMDL